jgi:hypothetical protein
MPKKSKKKTSTYLTRQSTKKPFKGKQVGGSSRYRGVK